MTRSRPLTRPASLVSGRDTSRGIGMMWGVDSAQSSMSGVEPAPSRFDPLGRRSVALAALLSAVLAVLFYSLTLDYPFVYDDVKVVGQDPRLEDSSFGLTVWTQQWWRRGARVPISRPLTSFTFWAQVQLHGRDATPIRAVNLALYAALCGLSAVLAAGWVGRSSAAWVVGPLFAVHPLHVEVIASVVGRAEILSLLLMVVGMLLWLRWRQCMTWPRAATIGLTVLGAGLAKEQGYLLAPILAVMELSLRRDANRPSPAWRTYAPVLVAIGVVVVVASAQRVTMIHSVDHDDPESIDPGTADELDNPLFHASTTERVVTPFKLVGKAGQLMIVPVNQSPDYSPRVLMPATDLGEPLVLFGLLIVLVWLGLTVEAWRRRWLVLGPLLALAITWAIPSNTVVLIGTIFGERLLFQPSLFALIILAAWVGRLDDRRAVRMAVAGVLVIAGLGYAWATVTYSVLWRDMITLVVSTVSRHPDSGRFQRFLATDLMQRGLNNPAARAELFAKAEERARIALELWPRQTDPYIVLGAAAAERGQTDLARQYFEMAHYGAGPNKFGDWGMRRLGLLESEEELEAEAERLEARLAEDPNDREAGLELADVQTKRRRFEQAVKLYQQFHTIESDDPAIIKRYIDALIGADELDLALDAYRRWMELVPDQWSILTDAAIVAITVEKDLAQARRWLERAIELSPGSAEPWAGLGQWHMKRGDKTRAAEAFREALRRSPPEDPKRPHYQMMLEEARK